LGRSARKTALYWLNGVKKPERRAERVATIVALLEKNLIPTGPRLHEAYRDLVKRSGAKA
jgi:predicted component of type VI protein secretion system